MNKLIVGWQEYISLPNLDIDRIKVKVDTGMRNSCLYAFKVEPFERNKEPWVKFWLHPFQDDFDTVKVCESRVSDKRRIRDAAGNEEIRYIIETHLCFNQHTWLIELSLSEHDNTRFRMVLGRSAINGRCLVDPSSSFLIS